MHNLLKAIRRLLVRIRVSSISVPVFLLFVWSIFVYGLALAADSWIVVLAASPIAFAVFITSLCLWAYRKDFYE